MDERLTLKEKIRKRKEFYNLYKKGERINSKYLVAIYYPNTLGFSRLGILVNKSIGKAVKRNKVKRWIRELFRRNKQLFTIPLDIIFLPKKSILETNWQELQEEYRKLIVSICLKKKKNEKNYNNANKIL